MFWIKFLINIIYLIKKYIKKIKINGNVYECVEENEKNMLINLKDNFKLVLIIFGCMEKYIYIFFL